MHHLEVSGGARLASGVGLYTMTRAVRFRSAPPTLYQMGVMM